MTREGLRPLPPQGRRASAACPTTASQGTEEPWRSASAALRPESGQGGPEIACRARPIRATRGCEPGFSPVIWEMSVKILNVTEEFIRGAGRQGGQTDHHQGNGRGPGADRAGAWRARLYAPRPWSGVHRQGLASVVQAKGLDIEPHRARCAMAESVRRVLQMAPAKGAPRSRSAGLGAGGPGADRRLAGGVQDHRPHESRGSLTPVEFARRWRMENEARVSDLVDG